MGKTHLTQMGIYVTILSVVIQIRDENFIERSDKVIKPDPRRRISLPKNLIDEGVMYRVYSNSAGQIMLDPVITIPKSELWLFKNKKALEMVETGLLQKGSVDLGSFAKYVEDET